MIDFSKADYAFSTSKTIPKSGWAPGNVPDKKLLPLAYAAKIDPPTFWAKMQFDRQIFDQQPIALFIKSVEQNYQVYLNGNQIYRSATDRSGRTLGWNHPLYLPIPAALLLPRKNELVIRVETAPPQLLSMGTIKVGPDAVVKKQYEWQKFFEISGPQIVSGYLLVLVIGAITFWARRPKEYIYGWISLVGLVWIFRNLHYFIQNSPIERELFYTLTTDSIFALLAIVFGMSVSYFRLPNARWVYSFIFGTCGIALVSRRILTENLLSELPSFLLVVPLCIVMLFLLARASFRSTEVNYWSMFFAITVAVLFSFHDLLISVSAFKGAAVAIQPYGGLLIFATFDATLTNRLQTALIHVEDVNLRLEARVSEVTQNLIQSEAERARLQVTLAVEEERERMMREIHDGIGSSLITALAGAKKRMESPQTIETLSRSLTDLRIGVDSLDPIEGDIVALLANLRHRVERELNSAGLEIIWDVQSLPPLKWLDPAGALHILRILQETIGNILTHAQATVVQFGCRVATHNHAAGVIIQIGDNGTGFLTKGDFQGKGLGNMAARASALHGHFSCDSSIGKGTTNSIWLPMENPHITEIRVTLE
ncbi:MAG: hypothetical protein V7676_11610 [Parasphingorhabdus sp.]